MHTRKATLWAARYRWAELLRRIYEVDPLAYPRCAAPMRIVAVLTDPAVITRILAHRPAASLARRRPARILRPGRRKFLLNQWQAWEALIPSAVSLYIARRIKCRITCQSHNTERGGLVNMRTRLFSVVGLAFLLVAAARPAHAQAWQFGPQLSFADKHFHLGIGARAVLDLERLAPSVKNVSIIGTFDYFFPDVSGNPWEINVNGAYRFSTPNVKIFPYAGAGLGFTHWGAYSFNKAHLNLVGGTKFQPLGKIQPFAEVRLKLRSGGGQFVITGGVLF